MVDNPCIKVHGVVYSNKRTYKIRQPVGKNVRCKKEQIWETKVFDEV